VPTWISWWAARAPRWLEFKGLYKEGAAGENDSRFMMTIAEAAWTTTQPDAGLLDLRDLAYSWGDNLDWIANFSPSGNRPTAVVVGDRNKKAILSLFVAQSIDLLDNFFETFEQAWQYLERKVEDKGK
jgi:hypothetical protein